MAGNSFGQVFRITTFGESHGKGIGVVIDGCPSGLTVDESLIKKDLLRRRPGQSSIVTQRNEIEEFEILSGIFENCTTGAPIAIFIPNRDSRSKDYSHIADKYRPSHADYVYDAKFGVRDYRGGGRSSARETAARVAAGAIAKMLLSQNGISIHAFVSQIGHCKMEDTLKVDLSQIEANIVRCPDQFLAEQMIKLIEQTKKQGDTIGGRISCLIKGCPTGLGEPVFDKLHADLAKAMLSINAAKGFEYGSGFSSIVMNGTSHNDVFYKDEQGNIATKTNFSGGIQGGISNGQDIYFNVAFKPVSTIMKDQNSIDTEGETTEIKGKGRHDPCVVPRAVPIVEAMAALVLADHFLRNKSSRLSDGAN